MAPEVDTSRPKAKTPPTKSTDEAKPHQHRLAQAQGDQYKSAVKHMAETVADVGAEAQAGDMIVALAIEKAEGMYEPGNGGLEWMSPGGENIHVEIAPRDAADNRFIPGLDVKVRITADDGSVVASGTLPMLWHPWLYHYGANFAVPRSGTYTIEAEIASPSFPRHDKENGCRYTEDVYVRFDEVEIELES